ncbi:MAG TPA: sigma-70 family RNA polymerase sigma factor [Kofleriaceae bacterium]|nr:sigma-70 family RNA polymerase sigma factor [Kofleriaceae bacterium]
MGTLANDDGDDLPLVASIAGGDRDALAALYDRYGGRMLALGLRVLGDRREAEDVLHDVFIEVWQHAGDFDPARGSVRAWLFVRMRSRTLDRCRRTGRARAREADQAVPEAATATDPVRATDQRRVLAALKRLPRAQQQVIELSYFLGLSSSAMAAKLDLPVGTIKSRVAAALAKLRAAFGPSPGDHSP